MREALAPVLEGAARATGEHVEELLNDLDDGARRVTEHSKRADDIVNSMVSLSQSNEPKSQRADADINAVVRDAVSLAESAAQGRRWSRKVALELDLDEGIGALAVFAPDLGRALAHMLHNAFYAVARRTDDEGRAYVPTVRVTTRGFTDRVEVSVRDNGVGIAASILDKVWDPFFTTKPPNEGTGLGLSICHDIIVQQHAGSVTVESEAERGAHFLIALPRSGRV